MPADGELRFMDIIFRQVKGQFHGATQNECLRTAFANGLMCCGAAYMGGYLYTHSVSAAFNRFGMAGFTLGMLATGITCSVGKFKEQKDS